MSDPNILVPDLPIAALRAYCQKRRITELSLFGSMLRDDFNDQSDIDLLVVFEDGTRYTLFDLATMQEELTTLLGRDVDLHTRRSVEQSKNSIRRREILSTLQVIYAA